MWFRHLDYPPDTSATALGPAGLDSLLERGDLAALTPLLRTIAHDPWSATADTVMHLCQAHPMYGTSALWRAWIERRREVSRPAGESLAQARVRAGLTQLQMAERLGISQSDVSKLERRADLRVSTLRGYVQALGARLHLALQGPEDAVPRPLALGVAVPTAPVTRPQRR
jgi:hypothetical protein